jgi:hypothetical protein
MSVRIDQTTETVVPQVTSQRFYQYLKDADAYFSEGRPDEGIQSLQMAFKETERMGGQKKALKAMILNKLVWLFDDPTIKANFLLHAIFNLLEKESIALEKSNFSAIENTPFLVRQTLLDDLNAVFQSGFLSQFAMDASKEELFYLSESMQKLFDLKIRYLMQPLLEKLRIGRLGLEFGKLQEVYVERFQGEEIFGGVAETIYFLKNAQDASPSSLIQDGRFFNEEIQEHIEILQKKKGIATTITGNENVQINPDANEDLQRPIENSAISQASLPTNQESEAPESSMAWLIAQEQEGEGHNDDLLEQAIVEINKLKEKLQDESCDFYQLIFHELHHRAVDRAMSIESSLAFRLKCTLVYHTYYSQKKTHNLFYIEICEKYLLSIKKEVEQGMVDANIAFKQMLEREIAQLEQSELLFSGLVDLNPKPERKKRFKIF